ncbi:MAG: aminopeptidase N [Streptosporangiales bacterium]|nr:aminopeptidase N [Streptosporangiales bacterium]
MAGNLTRDEARERARLLTVESYAVDLDLTGGESTFSSTTVIRFRCAEPGVGTFVDLTAPEVREITLNGRPIEVGTAFAGERVALPGLAADNELRVVADCAYMRTGEGLHRFTDPVDGKVYLYSQFETADAHRMYTCFDQPDLKASFEFTVTAPDDWTVISNNAPDIAGEAAGAGRAKWHFPPTPRISPYITAIIAGPYHSAQDEHAGIPLGIYCRASLAEHLDPDAIFEITKQGLDFYREAFGMDYPFAKYDQLFVPEFNAGAMENAGAVTFLEDYIFRSRVTDAVYERRAETILHEMAHMWFGDLVTMRWWDDLWLNESFATYMSVLCQTEATRWRGGWTTFANLWKAWAYRQDQLPSTHPIAADIPDIHAVEVNFDGITYAKGASVLAQLVAWVGHEEFLAAMRAYFRRHAWGNTNLQDLLSALEETSGRDLTLWSKEWLETAGVNTLRPGFEVDGEGRFTSFAVLQEAPAEHPTLRSHRVAVGLYDRAYGEIVRRRRVELDVVGERTEVAQLLGEPRPDLVLLNDDDLTYAKLRLDEGSLRTLVGHIAEIRESLPRALCWGAAWDMCRDAEMPARDYVRLVLSGIRGVSDITVLQTLLRQARMVLYNYADPAWRETGTRQLADALQEMLGAAEPGSDRQLAFAQAFIEVAVSPQQLELLRGLLDGSADIEGLLVDTELRWALLRRLVARGVADEPDIETEFARDRTAIGERYAATCRALRPTPEAKAETWRQLIEGQVPNAVLRALVSGFQHPDQAALLRPYAEKYFEVVGEIWESWTGEMAQNFAVGLYPAVLNEDRTIQLTDDYIERQDPPPALRRLLLEGRDGIVRALRAQECDRAAGTS